jgi:demethylmenaquinone methyltransferase / 2-methoxy-6-polyprenyl-1,4-benzoquinol methylase
MNTPDTSGKKVKVEQMFNEISGRYDLLNHLLSFGIDRRWRNKLIRRLEHQNPILLLDVATGTGDLAIAAALATNARITATDIAEKMMDGGRKKVASKGLTERISFRKADAEALPFEPNTFDALMVAFGVRNFENLGQGLSEFLRVLRPGGQALILEFSMPASRMLKLVYKLYFGKFLPVIGRMISKHPDAYTYLPDSVDHFPHGEAFASLLSDAGFVHVTQTTLSGGIATLYEGVKSS